jgi:energy-coupling factor transport system permease protein
VVWYVYTSGASRARGGHLPLGPMGFALVAVPFGALLNGLTSHVGATVFLRIPAWVPLLGGPVTLEALIYGAVNGLNLAIVFGGFAAFSRALSARDVLQLTPKAFKESGVVVSIAMSFVPQAVRNLQRIREAQAVRGHRVSGLRDWLPIVTPLLVGALERALGLAEAMVARGYATITNREYSFRVQGLLVFGLLTLLGGWLGYLLVPQARVASFAGLVLGLGLLGASLHLAGRSVMHTAYRRRAWTMRDTVIVLGCLMTLGLLVWRRSLLDYSPYPYLTWPAFDPLVGLALVGLLAPGLFAGSILRRPTEAERSPGQSPTLGSEEAVNR